MHRSSGSIKGNEFREWGERMLGKYDSDAFHHHSNPFVRFIVIPLYWPPSRDVIRLDRKDAFMEMESESKEGMVGYGN